MGARVEVERLPNVAMMEKMTIMTTMTIIKITFDSDGQNAVIMPRPLGSCVRDALIPFVQASPSFVGRR